MATEAQVAANRANARKSTGPRTAEGKAVVSQNAVKHGLLAREGVLRGEDGEEFEMHREMLLEELQPVGALLEGVEDLARRLYDPESFAERVLGFVDRLEPGPPSPWLPPFERSSSGSAEIRFTL